MALNKTRPEQTNELLVRFYLRLLGQGLAREGEVELAAEQAQAARAVSPGLAEQVIWEKGFEGQEWTRAG